MITDRTDMAFESLSTADSAKLSGVSHASFNEGGFVYHKTVIADSDASCALCKPIGTYYTFMLDKFISRKEDSFSVAAGVLSRLLCSLSGFSDCRSFLIACLGNRNITPDAYGSHVSDSIFITRHVKTKCPDYFFKLNDVSLVRPGVLASTGIESADCIRAVCSSVKPDCVIAVDALASKSFGSLCRTVQLCDSGIAPGSGVRNNRTALNADLLGVPVFAIGVPTVIDASGFIASDDAADMFVTPRNIDELAASSAKLTAYAINLAVNPSLSISDLDLLLE